MIALLLILLFVGVLLAAVNHYLFPIPSAVWFIFAAIVVVVLFLLLLGAVDGAELETGNGH